MVIVWYSKQCIAISNSVKSPRSSKVSARHKSRLAAVNLPISGSLILRGIGFHILKATFEHSNEFTGEVDGISLDGHHAGDDEALDILAFLVQCIQSGPGSLLGFDAGTLSKRDSNCGPMATEEANSGDAAWAERRHANGQDVLGMKQRFGDIEWKDCTYTLLFLAANKFSIFTLTSLMRFSCSSSMALRFLSRRSLF